MQTTISPRPTGHEHSNMMMIGSEGDQSFPYFYMGCSIFFSVFSSNFNPGTYPRAG
ncbi:hypothetical protein QR685DRAFT_530493 [Neurospora intermedia]|uniref:Uncharacterized protein n=1 Tax=Neurospora intermedia TaxID=5142 RepID=A0ABR3D6F5_NEUIN